MNLAVNGLRRFKIRQRLLLFLILALIISSVCILLVTRTVAQALLKNYLYNYLKSSQEEIAASAELIIDEINMLAVRLTVNSELYHLFNQKQLSFAEREAGFRQRLDHLLVHKELVGAIYIVDHQNEIYEYAPVGRIMQQPDLLDVGQVKNASLPLWGAIKKDQSGDSYILFSRKFHNFYTGESLGYLFIYVRESALNNVYRQIAATDSFSFIVDDRQRIISHPNAEQVGSVIFDAALFETATDFSYKRVRYQGQPVILAISKFNNGNFYVINALSSPEVQAAAWKWLTFELWDEADIQALANSAADYRAQKQYRAQFEYIPLKPDSPYVEGRAKVFRDNADVLLSWGSDGFLLKLPQTAHIEPPIEAQVLYAQFLAPAVQAVLSDQKADPARLLKDANARFQREYLDNVE